MLCIPQSRTDTQVRWHNERHDIRIQVLFTAAPLPAVVHTAYPLFANTCTSASVIPVYPYSQKHASTHRLNCSAHMHKPSSAQRITTKRIRMRCATAHGYSVHCPQLQRRLFIGNSDAMHTCYHRMRLIARRRLLPHPLVSSVGRGM